MSKKSQTDSEIVEIKLQQPIASVLIQAVKFLEIFLPKTLAKRFVAIILLAIGIPVKTAVGLSGLSERSLWTLHKQLSESLGTYTGKRGGLSGRFPGASATTCLGLWITFPKKSTQLPTTPI